MAHDFKATIRLFNYRCFTDKHPGVLELRPGFSAFVGPNNSGKSTLLKAIRELRAVLSTLADHDMLHNFAKGSTHAFNYLDVEDPEEIFCDSSKGPAVVEITFPEAFDNETSRVRLMCQREAPGGWSGEIFYGPKFSRITPAEAGEFGLSCAVPGGRQDLDFARAKYFAHLIAGSMYVPPFRHALTGAGGASMGDLSNGSEFLGLWTTHQGGGSKAQHRLIRKVVDDVRALFSYDRFDVQASAGSQTLQLWVNGKDYRLREMGSGLTQFLIVLGNAAFKRPALIFVDEPELNLHPTLQQEFLTTLGSYCTYGVFFATHSLGLARSSSDFLYSVRKSESGSTVASWEHAVGLAEQLGELNYSAYREAGHERVLLVEGPQDIRSIQQILRLLRIEHSTLVIHLSGGQTESEAAIEAVAEIQRLASNVFVLLDSERNTADGEPRRGRQLFVERCARLDVKVHLTQRRALENYFTDRAVKAAYGAEYCALELYAKLSESSRPWGKRDNWRAAREMSLDEWDGTDIFQFLKSLTDT